MASPLHELAALSATLLTKDTSPENVTGLTVGVDFGAMMWESILTSTVLPPASVSDSSTSSVLTSSSRTSPDCALRRFGVTTPSITLPREVVRSGFAAVPPNALKSCAAIAVASIGSTVSFKADFTMTALAIV